MAKPQSHGRSWYGDARILLKLGTLGKAEDMTSLAAMNTLSIYPIRLLGQWISKASAHLSHA